MFSPLEQWVQGRGGSGAYLTLRQPDLTLWFDLDPALAAQRLAGARVPDKFESQPVAFFEAVRAGYADRADQEPHRFARLEANQSREAVWADVLAAVQAKGYL